MENFVHIELHSKNDSNGNPRRLSLLMINDNGDQKVLAVQDHGYKGSPRGWGYPACSVDVPPAEYKYWTKGNTLNIPAIRSAGVVIPEPYGKKVSS